MINQELAKFNPVLAKRPMLVAGNKCDLATDEQIQEFKEFVENQGYAFFPMMAAISYQVEPLLKKIQEMLSALPPVERYEPEPVPVLPAEEIGLRRRENHCTGPGLLCGRRMAPAGNEIGEL